LPNRVEVGILVNVDITRTAKERENLTRTRTRKKKRRATQQVMARFYLAAVRVSAVIVGVYFACQLAGWGLTRLAPKPPTTTPDPPPVSAGSTSASGSAGQEQPPDVPQGPVRKEDFLTFLLVGTDDGNGNADTLMVASFDMVNRKVALVSIPRDTIMPRTWSNYPKINGAYGGGGIPMVRQEVSQLLGIPIDYYVKVDVKAFVEIVDTVQGVDFDVPVDMDYDDPWQDLSIHFKKGLQHLDGQQALEVVRFRHNNDMTGYTDIGRTQTQQKLLVAVAKKVLSLGNVTKIGDYVNIFTTYVDTDLTVTQIIGLVQYALTVDLNTGITTKTLEGRGDATHNGYKWCYELDLEQTLEDINSLLNPYTTDITAEMTGIVKANGGYMG